MLEARPVSAEATGVAASPDPALTGAVIAPNDVVVPYSNTYAVATPFGSTVPPRLAPVSVIAAGAPDTTAGATGGCVNCAKRSRGSGPTARNLPPT